ncbi:MAG TPA: M48 family metallopeptidase [Terriglobales bacterium]|jgi:STE24 endopeptidase|nr:M48 family metallopeptidase [Terriglobales bacterium]
MASPDKAQPPDSAEARKYNQIRRRVGVSEFLLGLGLLVVLLLTGWTAWLRDLAWQTAFQSYALALFLYVLMLIAISKAVSLGLDYYGFRVEHRYQLSNQRLRAWAWDEVKGLLLTALLGGALVELLYLIIRDFPAHWWLVAWVGFLAIAVLMAQLAPVVLFPIFYKFEPLHDEDLRLRLVRLGERAGTRIRGVYKWHLSEKSKKANAALTGLGATRRIILADTLLENYSPDEIEAVLAHELGHHVHKHILKSIGVQAAVTFVGFWAANWTLHYAINRWHMFESLSDFANLPLLVLTFTVLSFVLMPALNGLSRFHERQADRYALSNIAGAEPFISSMNKLADQNLAERTPSRWVEWWFHSHPAIARRVAAAEAWAKAKG